MMSSRAPDPDYVLRGHTASVTSVSYGDVEESTALVSGGSNGDVKIWDIRIRKPVLNTTCNSNILHVCILSNRKLLSHSRDGKVQLFDVRGTLQPFEDFSVGDGTFCPVSSLETNGDVLIAAPSGYESKAHVLHLHTKEILAEFEPNDKLGMIMQLKLFQTTEEIFLAAGYEDGSLHLWDVKNGSDLASVQVEKEPVMALDVDETNMRAIIGSATSTLSLVDLSRSRNTPSREMSKKLEFPGIGAVCFRPDKKLIAIGCWNGRIRLFGGKRLKPLALLKYHNEIINTISFSPTFQFAAGSRDAKISVWSVYKLS